MQTIEQMRPQAMWAGPQSAKTHAQQLHEIIARAVPIVGTPGDYLMRDDVLCRSGLSIVHAAPVTEAPKDRLIVRFVVVSGEEARDNKHLHVEGIDFRAWDETPVIPWCHRYDQPTLGRGLWRATYRRADTHEMWSDVEFMPADLADDPWVRFANAIGKMYAGGWMRGISAGWIPKQIREIRSKSGRLLKLASVTSEFIEQSCCPIPVDRWALAEAKDRGVITSDEVETIGRTADWRELNESEAYDLTARSLTAEPDDRENIDMKREAITRAFKPSEARELVDERHLDPEAKLGALVRPSTEDASPMTTTPRSTRVGDVANRAEGSQVDQGDQGSQAETEAEAQVAGDPSPGDEAVEAQVDQGSQESAQADGDAARASKGAQKAPESLQDASGVEADTSQATPGAQASQGAQAPQGDQSDSAPGEAQVEAQVAAQGAPSAQVAPGDVNDVEGHASRPTAAILRGPVSDELDLAYDKMRGAVVGMVDATENLWTLTHQAFFSGRSVNEMLGLKRGGYGYGDKSMDPSDPESPISLDQLVHRQLNRLEGQTQTVADSIEMFRDAMSGASTDTIVQEAAALEQADAIASTLEGLGVIDERAGRKIRQARRENLGGILKVLKDAVKKLADVLSEPEKVADEYGAEDVEQDRAKSRGISAAISERLDLLERRRSGQSQADARVAERLGTMGVRAAKFLDRLANQEALLGDVDSRSVEPVEKALPTVDSETSETQAPTRQRAAKPRGFLPGIATPTRKLGDEFADMISSRLGQMRSRG